MRGGITYPEGFKAAGGSCGIKPGDKPDCALIMSEKDCIAAGCFTTNQFKSYSLLWTVRQLRRPIRAVVVNSGNANTCNGKESWDRTRQVAEAAGLAMDVPATSVLLASTGIIGNPLPHEKLVAAIPALVRKASEAGHAQAATAIMTTDTRMKEVTVDTGLKGRRKEVVIGGMTKGAGMINPTMATMLAFLTTDAVIARDVLQAALKEAVEDSFNMVTVDDDQSTNDSVVCLANGRAGNQTIKAGTPAYAAFAAALREACAGLARQIAFDGEGATKSVTVKVTGGASLKDVRRAAKRIAGSNLVKTALAGQWPNWGRILAAAGSTNARMDVARVEVKMCGVTVYRNGGPTDFSEEEVKKLLKKKGILLEMDLAKGQCETTAWGCDLTKEYVEINLEE